MKLKNVIKKETGPNKNNSNLFLDYDFMDM